MQRGSRRTLDAKEGQIKIEKAFHIAPACKPDLWFLPANRAQHHAPGRARRAGRSGFVPGRVRLPVRAADAADLVADAAVRADALSEQQQRFRHLHLPCHRRLHRGHRGPDCVLGPVRVFHPAARVGPRPPGRDAPPASSAGRFAPGYRPRMAAAELAHPDLQCPAHSLHELFPRFGLYHPAGCAGIHSGCHPGQRPVPRALSGRGTGASGAVGRRGAGAAAVRAGAQKPVAGRPGELRLCARAVFPRFSAADTLEPFGRRRRSAAAAGSGRAAVWDHPCGGAGEHAGHVRHVPGCTGGGAALL